jgi:hypothetical protein
MAKKTNWQPTDNRFISFIDIMGFKDLVLRSPHEEVYSLLTEISNIRNYIEKTTNGLEERYEDAEVDSASFSDSIILFSKNDTPASFDLLVYSTSFLFAKAIERNIPLKGAIAYGKISLNKPSQIYFGQPLINAYLLEEEMHYYGVVAHHSILDYIHRNENEIKSTNGYLFNCFTPLKGGLINHTNLDWFRDLNEADDKEIVKIKDNDFKKAFYDKMKVFASKTSGAPRKYLDNTIKVFEERHISSIVKQKALKPKKILKE